MGALNDQPDWRKLEHLFRTAVVTDALSHTHQRQAAHYDYSSVRIWSGSDTVSTGSFGDAGSRWRSAGAAAGACGCSTDLFLGENSVPEGDAAWRELSFTDDGSFIGSRDRSCMSSGASR